MSTLEFLAQLNTAIKGWGLWISRDDLNAHHIGQYSFENDRLPKNFVYVGNLEDLAHIRQKYILTHLKSPKNEDALGKEWAESFLSQWKAQWLVPA